MAQPWSRTESGMLREMWLCGIRSGDVAHILGRTRHAVMGKIQRSGLMKRQGEGILPRGTHARDAGIAIAVTFPDILGRNRRPGAEDDVCAVLLAMVADGRRSRRITNVTAVPHATVRIIDDKLTASGLWPRQGGARPEWWLEGHDAIRRAVVEIAQEIPRQLDAA